VIQEEVEFNGPFGGRNSAHWKRNRQRAMVMLSGESSLFLKRNLPFLAQRLCIDGGWRRRGLETSARACGRRPEERVDFFGASVIPGCLNFPVVQASSPQIPRRLLAPGRLAEEHDNKMVPRTEPLAVTSDRTCFFTNGLNTSMNCVLPASAPQYMGTFRWRALRINRYPNEDRLPMRKFSAEDNYLGRFEHGSSGQRRRVV